MKNNIYKKIGQLRHKIDAIKKTNKNPFFNSNYADINEIEKVVEPIENEIGLTHFYTARVENGTQILTLHVVDTESGEELKSELEVILAKQDMQQMIAGFTYGRRGLLVAFYSLEAEDDDGNTVSGKYQNDARGKGELTEKQIKYIEALIRETKSDRDKFLEYFGVKSTKELSYKDFNTGINILKSKLKGGSK